MANHVFMEATIYISKWSHEKSDFIADCFRIRHIDSPAVQKILQMVDEGDYMRIANLGLLLVKNVDYTKGGSILIGCRNVRKNGNEAKEEV